MKMNRKGDIPTALLFIAAIVLSIVALISFVTFKDNFSMQSQQFSSIMTELNFKEKYIFENAKSFAKKSIQNPYPSTNDREKTQFHELAEEKPFIYPGTEQFFTKTESYSYTFEKSDNIWTFEMQDLTLTSEQENSKITRTINLCMKFNEKGDFIENCERFINKQS